MDNRPVLTLFFPFTMEPSQEKHASPVTVVVDIILCAAFFAFMYWVLKSHVPSNDPKWIVIWGAATSACMTGVFWLALWMFRVVFRAQRARQ